MSYEARNYRKDKVQREMCWDDVKWFFILTVSGTALLVSIMLIDTYL